MTLNDTAATYGLFQVVFADVVDHLAVATFHLRERKESGLVFESVFKQEFKKLFKQFRQELKQFDGRSPVADSLYGVREACKIISEFAVFMPACTCQSTDTPCTTGAPAAAWKSAGNKSSRI